MDTKPSQGLREKTKANSSDVLLTVRGHLNDSEEADFFKSSSLSSFRSRGASVLMSDTYPVGVWLREGVGCQSGAGWGHFHQRKHNWTIDVKDNF